MHRATSDVYLEYIVIKPYHLIVSMNDASSGQDPNLTNNADPSVSTLTTQNLNGPQYSALIRRYYLGNPAETGSPIKPYQARTREIDLGDITNQFESEEGKQQTISMYEPQHPGYGRGIQLDQPTNQQMDTQLDPTQGIFAFAPPLTTEHWELMGQTPSTGSPQLDTRSCSIDPLTRRTSLEISFKKGWYKCFLVWIYFVTVLAMMAGIATILIVIPYVQTRDYIFYLVPVGWAIVQFSFEIGAMLTQNVLKATIGLGLMIILKLYLLTMLIYSVVTALSDFAQREVFYILNICGFGSAFILQLSCIYGAIQVRKILKRIQNEKKEAYKAKEMV